LIHCGTVLSRARLSSERGADTGRLVQIAAVVQRPALIVSRNIEWCGAWASMQVACERATWLKVHA
jgi:hypothetical protein